MAAGRAPTITAVSDDSAAAAAGSGSSKVVLGVCGMGRKVHSKPMRAILDRKWLSINVFDERTILEEGVDKWPRCDALLSFYASDFPLHKAVTYAKRYRPFVINDPDMQYTLLDRPKVYSMLRKHGIDQPRHAILIRDEKYGPVYAVGPSYAHAEARKSPALDGKVDRDSHGKEIRYPVILSNKEKMIARKIVMAFGQVLRRTLQTLSVRAAPVPAWYQADDPPLVPVPHNEK